ncbi:MAG: hypothetical protein IIC13_18815 [SAR324 cluster bacterium]|nr:hypothetical protein [SAR324 cluster bacterium]
MAGWTAPFAAGLAHGNHPAGHPLRNECIGSKANSPGIFPSPIVLEDGNPMKQRPILSSRPINTRGGNTRFGFSFHLFLTMSCLISFLGCAGPVPVTPFPKVVRVAHPAKAPQGKSHEALMEMYSASPERNPDGLGAFRLVWLNSRMTLLTWPAMAIRLERNRIAYAMTKSEQEDYIDHLHMAIAAVDAGRIQWISMTVKFNDGRQIEIHSNKNLQQDFWE